MMAVDQIARMMAMDAAQQGGGGGDSYTKAETDELLDGKADLVDGKVPASQLPSYVDDVAEYSSTAAFPATGESGKIYVATDTNKTYRWGGSAYVEISESLALGETASTAYPGNKGKANADAISAIKDGTNIDSFADVETALANIPQVTVDQTYSASSTNAQSGVAIDGKKPGLKTTGTEYTISGQTVTAGPGAEVFNDYTNNKASGIYSHAEGGFTTASGSCSHAEGAGIASGLVSHAEGFHTTASGPCSHAEGFHTTASGDYSHAEGEETAASGDSSHAEGKSTIAASQNQHVQGKFNVVDSSGTYAFIIGNGTSTSARHNAFAIDWNGLVYVNGAATGVDVSQLTPVTVDQTYNAQSANPQSGTAVAQALQTIPSITVDQTYSGNSTNAQSGAAIYGAFVSGSATGNTGFTTIDGTATYVRQFLRVVTIQIRVRFDQAFSINTGLIATVSGVSLPYGTVFCATAVATNSTGTSIQPCQAFINSNGEVRLGGFWGSPSASAYPESVVSATFNYIV